MISTILQAQLLTLVRTGDPVTDALLASAVVGAVCYVAAHWETAWSELQKYVGRRKASVRIPQYEDGFTNEYYDALRWYLSERASSSCSAATAHCKRGLSEGSMTPDSSVVFRHRYQDHPLQIWFVFVETKMDSYIHVKREAFVRTREANVLREFVADILRLHRQHVKKMAWSQKIYTITPQKDADKEGGQVWTPMPTHNNKTFSSVVLERGLKGRLMEDLQDFLGSESLYTNMGIGWTRGYLLHGVPGCGKSSIVKALSNTAKMNIYDLNLSAVRNDDHLQLLFRNIPFKSVVLIEDVDCMSDVVCSRQTCSREPETSALEPSSDNTDLIKLMLSEQAKSTMTLSGLLNQLDGVCAAHGRILIMTSNHPEKLDQALLRPGRIDMKVELGLCTQEQIVDFYRLFFGDDDPPKSLYDIPGEVFTPAEVSNAFLSNRKDNDAAIAAVMSATR